MMFTRFVTCVTKHENREKLTTTLDHEVLPLLRKHTGFTDLMVLSPEMHTDTFLVISFWNTKADAERYMKETYPTVMEILRPHLTTMPEVATYNVESSTLHRIAAGRAA